MTSKGSLKESYPIVSYGICKAFRLWDRLTLAPPDKAQNACLHYFSEALPGLNTNYYPNANGAANIDVVARAARFPRSKTGAESKVNLASHLLDLKPDRYFLWEAKNL
jgi:hypothetical protein